MELLNSVEFLTLGGHGSDTPQKGIVQIPVHGLIASADDSHDFRIPLSDDYFATGGIFGALFQSQRCREERKSGAKNR